MILRAPDSAAPVGAETAAAIIFRIELFKRSETFITSQVRRLRRYHPVFLGRLDHEAPAEFQTVAVAPSKWAWLSMLLGSSSAVRKAVAGVGARVVHAHFATDGAVIAPYAAACSLPLVVTLHGYDVAVSTAAIFRSRHVTLIVSYLRRRYLFKTASRFLCVSQYILDIAERKGFPRDKLLLHYIGIDLDRLTPAEDFRRDEIIHICRLVEKKGTAYLIKAMPEVVRQRPAAHLIIMGDGPLASDLRALTTELRMEGHVTFHGETSHAEAMARLRTATVACVPSVTASNGDSEGLPTVVLEAGALGVPTVASRTSGIPEAIEDGVTGLLAEERDVGALARSLVSILTDDGLRTRMGTAARALMERRFDQRVQTALLEEIYDACAGS